MDKIMRANIIDNLYDEIDSLYDELQRIPEDEAERGFNIGLRIFELEQELKRVIANK